MSLPSSMSLIGSWEAEALRQPAKESVHHAEIRAPAPIGDAVSRVCPAVPSRPGSTSSVTRCPFRHTRTTSLRYRTPGRGKSQLDEIAVSKTA
jgi:hypothetical protein